MISLFSGTLLAQPASFQSGEGQTTLIELYSSEGCSSCPPADRWVAELKNNKKLWKEFVPLNFHVDYWNRLGWVDRFSHEQFTQRQRQMASEWGSGRIYTPAFVRNGEEWRQRSLTNLMGTKVGILSATLVEKNRYKVVFQTKAKPASSYKINVALLGNGLTTEVKTGENAGETLHHEFVVLASHQENLPQKSGQYEAIVEVPKNKQSGAQKFSLAFWVTQGNSLKPIQATGGYL